MHPLYHQSRIQRNPVSNASYNYNRGSLPFYFLKPFSKALSICIELSSWCLLPIIRFSIANNELSRALCVVVFLLCILLSEQTQRYSTCWCSLFFQLHVRISVFHSHCSNIQKNNFFISYKFTSAVFFFPFSIFCFVLSLKVWLVVRGNGISFR